MKGYFIICDPGFSTDKVKSVGVYKKIFSQVDILNDGNLSCELLNIYRDEAKGAFFKFISRLFKTDTYEDFRLKNCDFLYIRKIPVVTKAFLVLLKNIKKINPNCIIVYEVPTYPYDLEIKNIKERVNLLIDKIFRNKLNDYVDRIVTFTQDEEIFNVPTIKIVNGIDCKQIIPSSNTQEYSKSLNLIAVAQFCKWHGYDRLINGLADYYKTNPGLIVKLNLVGDGPELQRYKNLVNNLGLKNYVFFLGTLSGDELSKQYDESHIAINSLGCHRIGIYNSSALKSREYLARGLPIVTSVKIDILDSDYEYCLKIPEDESNVNISIIVDFYHNLVKKYDCKEISRKIRLFAEQTCDMKVTMSPIINFLERSN